MIDLQINVGIAAIARGWITPEAFVKIMQAITRSPATPPHTLWVVGGYLSDRELTQLLDEVSNGSRNDTVIMSASTPPPPAAAVAAAVPAPLRDSADLTTKVGRQPNRQLPNEPATAPTAASFVEEPHP